MKWLLLSCTCYAATITQDAPQRQDASPRQDVVSAEQRSVLDEVAALVEKHFYDPDLLGIDWRAQVAAHRPAYESAESPRERSDVMNKLLAHLQASHTEHLGPWDPHYYHLRGVFASGGDSYRGIGVQTEVIGGKTFITQVFDGLPADRADLRVGDELIAVNGSPYYGLESFTKDGDGAQITIRRAADAPAQSVETAVEHIHGREVFVNAMSDSIATSVRAEVTIGYVHVWSHAGIIYHELLVQLLGEKPLCDADALVLDLRGGLGGAQPRYLEIFNTDVPSMTLVARDGARTDFDDRWRKPVVLLVDETTRSGKEVFAYAFKKAKIGPVVGARTAGAVVGGQMFNLSDGTILYLAVADVLIDGERLEGVGVEPDIPVPFELPYADGADPRLARAIEEAAKLVAK